MKRLLVPIDGSANSLRALRHAIRLVQEHGSESLHLVYAHPEPVLYGELSVYVPREKIEELQRQHGEGILSGGEEILNEAGIDYTREILVGPVAATIARRADELGCDLIVMGTRGMTPIAGMVMGSVTMKVVHFANVPVTLVK